MADEKPGARKSKAKAVVESVKKPPKTPRIDDFVQHFFDIAGGPREVAMYAWSEFKHAAPGSLMRQRILEMVMRTLKTADLANRNPDDMGQMSDEDLAREAESLLAVVAPKVADAEEATADHDRLQQAAGGDAGAGGPRPAVCAAGGDAPGGGDQLRGP